MHATPKSTAASTVAIDLAKDVFDLAFPDADARNSVARSRGSLRVGVLKPQRLPGDLLGHLQGESMHDWLGVTDGFD